MRTSDKIKGVLATCDLTYKDFAALVGVSRQTIHTYLNGPGYMEDYENGVRAMDVSNRLMALALEHKLPLPKGLPNEDKLAKIKVLLVS